MAVFHIFLLFSSRFSPFDFLFLYRMIETLIWVNSQLSNGILLCFLQVVNLQTQLASLKELQANQNFLVGSVNANPNEKCSGRPSQDVQSWFQSEITNYTIPQFSTNISINNASTIPYDENVFMENSFGNYGSSVNPDEENASNACYEEASHSMSSLDLHMKNNNIQWSALQDADDLQSVAFGYM